MSISNPRITLVRNAVSLYSAQGLQYLVPLITLPWMVQALGTEGYGWLNIVGAFGGYLQVLCDYGFSLSASRSIALIREDRNRLAEEVSALVGAKVVLALVGLLLAAIAVGLMPRYQAHTSWLAIGVLGALAMSFFPSWLFQGMERMGGMAALSTGARLVQLGLILALIRNPGDVGLALWISAGVSLASTLAAWILALNNFSIRLEFPSPRRVLDVLRNGFEIFISQAGTLLFANTNVMMLAAFATPEAVGMYAIAEKLVRVCIQIGYPIGTVLYPRVAILMQESRIEAFRFLRKILAWGSLGFLGIGILLVVAAPMAVRFICGHPEPDILPLVLILSPLPLTIFMDNIFGVQVVLNSGHRRAFMTVPLIAGLISVVLQWLLIRPFGATGAALSLLLSECFILVLFAILAKKLTEFSVFSARMPGP